MSEDACILGLVRDQVDLVVVSGTEVSLRDGSYGEEIRGWLYPTAAATLLNVYEPALVCTLVARVLTNGGLTCSLTSWMSNEVGSDLLSCG